MTVEACIHCMGSGCGENIAHTCSVCKGSGTTTPADLVGDLIGVVRRLWKHRDGENQEALRQLYNAWRDLGIALAHLDGRRHISEA